MTRSALIFTAASLAPVPLLLLASTFGGAWVWAALLYLTLFAFAMDELVAVAAEGPSDGREFPAATALSVTLALAHFPVLALAVHALAGGAGFGPAEAVGLFFATGLFIGQIGNSNAHELIHARRRWLFELGKWVYISLLFGHHVSAHPLVHHRFVASEEDPNSARRGESYYRFARRAWIGSFRAGLRAETARRARAVRPGPHPYLVYGLGAGAGLAAAAALGGLPGLLAYFALAAYAQAQLLLSDYVQHYGLSRLRLPDGRLEPVRPRHSWNAPHWFTGHMMLNAPRHSDHHAHPSKPFTALELPGPDQAPILPYSLPAMGLLALFPRRWRRVMDPRAAAWQPARTARQAA